MDYSEKKMNYPEGVVFMKSISRGDAKKSHFTFGEFTINYPGYKEKGYYRLSYTSNDKAPKHTDVIDILLGLITKENGDLIAKDLENIYENGLKAETKILDEYLKTKIFWITLQEEINYPQPKFKGNRLPFQRFFETILVSKDKLSIEELYQRTNNHGKTVPVLINFDGLYKPTFYFL